MAGKPCRKAAEAAAEQLAEKLRELRALDQEKVRVLARAVSRRRTSSARPHRAAPPVGPADRRGRGAQRGAAGAGAPGARGARAPAAQRGGSGAGRHARVAHVQR
jgi:hypothetical protein